MGINIFSHLCSDSCVEPTRINRSTEPMVTVKTPILGNPDPSNFKVESFTWLQHKIQGDFLTILFVKYPDCSNYEGNKVILMKGRINPTILIALDPHFTPQSNIIARFKPDTQSTDLLMDMLKGIGYDTF